MPAVKDRPLIQPVGFSAEHGTLKLLEDEPALQPGAKISLVAGYGDLTVFLHERLIGVRNGRIETVWPIPRAVA